MPGGQLPRGVPASAGHAGHATPLLALLTHYFLLLTFFRACPALPRSWRRAAWSPWGWCRPSGWPAAPAPCRRRRSSWAAGWRGGRGSASGTWGVYQHVNTKYGWYYCGERTIRELSRTKPTTTTTPTSATNNVPHPTNYVMTTTKSLYPQCCHCNYAILFYRLVDHIQTFSSLCSIYKARL